jgi:hypothetical protein
MASSVKSMSDTGSVCILQVGSAGCKEGSAHRFRVEEMEVR